MELFLLSRFRVGGIMRDVLMRVYGKSCCKVLRFGVWKFMIRI